MEAVELYSRPLFAFYLQVLFHNSHSFTMTGSSDINVKGVSVMKMMRLLILILLLPGCATHLTDSGRKIKVVNNSDPTLQTRCEQLGSVTGESDSFLSGGDYGVIYATYDARNKVALIAGADTLGLVNSEPRRLGGEVAGIAYNCLKPGAVATQTTTTSPQKHEVSVKTVPAPPRKDPGIIYEKAKKCQNKGGVWVNDACVIPID